VAGGVQNQPSDDLFVYDPAQDAWESLGPLPLPTFYTTSATVAGRLYLFGGYSSGGNHDKLADVYEYDPVTKAWSQRASMPKARGVAAAVAIGGKVYLAGASDDGSGMEEYDPVMDSWTTKTSMNFGGGYALAFNDVDGLAYVVSDGITVEGSAIIEGPAMVQTYDPAKDR
jgi:N-acetylneuraminic acid mutarotase